MPSSRLIAKSSAVNSDPNATTEPSPTTFAGPSFGWEQFRLRQLPTKHREDSCLRKPSHRRVHSDSRAGEIPNDRSDLLSDAVVPRPYFDASLRRTSSLHPPPRITIENVPKSLAAPDTIGSHGHATTEAPRSPKFSKWRGHKRASSLGGLTDSLFTSSGSSHSSNNLGIGRRISLDVLGFGLGKKLNLTGGSGTSSHHSHTTATTSRVPPLQALPQIEPLGSLEQEVCESRALLAPTEVLRSAASRRPTEDPGLYWNDLHDSRTVAPGPLPKAENPRTIPSNASSEVARMMPYTQNGETKAHSRSRSVGAMGSTETATSSRSRDRSTKPPSQKVMLSKALAKANTAVQLDNDAEFEEARIAYAEACDLLQQVLQRTSGAEDRKKLEAIRQTYTSRIADLNELLPTSAPRPESTSFTQPRPAPNLPVSSSAAQRQHGTKAPTPGLENNKSQSYPSHETSLQSSFSRSPQKASVHPTLKAPIDSQYLPQPLSPRRPSTSGRSHESDGGDRIKRPAVPVLPTTDRLAPSGVPRGHMRTNSHESTSWLDPIDESGGSATSSVHSRSSSAGKVKRRHLRTASSETEAEFDAALDDAIEAAYDDGYDEAEQDKYAGVSQALRKAELAREKVRETEREILEMANEGERRLRLQLQDMEDEDRRAAERDAVTSRFYNGNDSDEEERILEELTRGFGADEFGFNGHTKPSSSSLTSRTSAYSDSKVTSTSKPPGMPPPPPPSQALPELPRGPNGTTKPSQTVQSRRLSGRSSSQNLKQLKIETSKVPTPIQSAPRTGGYIVQQRQALSKPTPQSARPLKSPTTFRDESKTPMPPTSLHNGEPRSGSPGRMRNSLRKTASASSLKGARQRKISISHLDDSSDPSTPATNPLAAGGLHPRLPQMPSLPTPIVTAFKMNTTSTGGLHLFDGNFPSPGSPTAGLPDSLSLLEPCPTAISLRPFWLMRCLYQTLCHPRGGYINNKLFVPRDVWRVKGVKLKNIEDKIGNCDILTAALQKLSRVDTNDADDVLDEMQAFENVLEQVQATLTRKLGSEVGVGSVGTMFKDASIGVVPGGDGGDGVGGSGSRSTSSGGKSSSFSWRRLRSKNSSHGLATAYGGKGGSGGSGGSATLVEGASGKDVPLPSVPMATQPTSKPPKRDYTNVVFGGPNAQYMASLAKLFDAAQVIDQFARQVEDPGLRHADKTQVGLELCTRHAAEFFGFYICRFVLADLAMLLDKFIKRGSEWVLA